MYLELAEGTRSRHSHQHQSRRFNPHVEYMQKMKKAYYIPVRDESTGKIVHMREDMFDTLSENEFDYLLDEAEEIESLMYEGGEFLGDKASRQAKKQARQERRTQRKATKDERGALKNEKKKAKIEVTKARADQKRAKGEAKKIKAEKSDGSKSWVDDVTDIAGAVGGVVGAFKGNSPAGSGDADAAGAEQDPSTGELTSGSGGLFSKGGSKSKTPLYIGAGVGGLILVTVLILALKPKHNKK